MLVNLLTIGNRWTLPVFFGTHPDKVWVGDARSASRSTALVLDMAITAVCLYLPIRSYMLPIMLVSGIVTYIVMLLIAPTPFDYYTHVRSTAALLVLAIFAYQGARRNEKMVRQKWLADRTVENQRTQIQQQHAQVQGSLSLAESMWAVV